MISFVKDNQAVQLPDGASIAFEMQNPLFAEGIPGSKVYNFDIRRTPAMSKLFGFPENLEAPLSSAEAIFPNWNLYLENYLWRRGTLKLKKVLPESFQFTFHSDAGEIASQYANTLLSDLDLGRSAPNYEPGIYPEQTHVFFPVQNPNFYEDEVNPDFGGIVNKYENGAFVANGASNTNTLVPFPYLLHVMNQAAQALGFYGVRGAWTEEESTKRLVVYNTRDIMQLQGAQLRAASMVEINQHVPQITISSFFRSIKNLFGLAIHINSQSRYIEISRISTVLASKSYYDITKASDKQIGHEKAFTGGFSLSMGTDSGDDLYKELSSADYSLQIGEGANPFKADCGTLFMDSETGLPQAKQSGIAPAFEQEGDFTFRLLFFEGMKNGKPSGTNALQSIKLGYSAYNGLYETAYKDWLNLLDSTQRIENKLRLSALDLINLDLNQKYRRDKLVYFIEEIKASVSQRGTSVSATLLKTYL